MRLLWVLAANAIALGVTDDWVALVLAALVFGVVNTLVKPIVTLLGLPLIILTLGILFFFINMLMLFLTDILVSGFDIEGFWTFVPSTMLVWVINVALELIPPFRRA